MNSWGLRGTLAAVGVAAVVAGIGGAGVYAATGATGHPERWHGRPGAEGPGAGHDAVHAESVVAAGEGFRTELAQTGVVTAVDAGSVTTRSADGFTRTYLIPAGVRTPPLVAGDSVSIEANATAQTPPTITTIRPRSDH